MLNSGAHNLDSIMALKKMRICPDAVQLLTICG